MDLYERCAKALNDEWAANPHHGAFWGELDESERERWREAVKVVLRTANYQGAVEALVTIARDGEGHWAAIVAREALEAMGVDPTTYRGQ